MRAFALFGDPVAHSISPRLHNKAIAELNLQAFYSRFLLKDGKELVNIFKKLKLNGANVTVPHKTYALNLADFVSTDAREIGSANTLVLKDDKIYAYNTDAPGFMRAIAPFGRLKNALIIGAGGTAKAIAYALKKANVEVAILNRSNARFVDFADYECFTYENFTPKGFGLVINSTSAGLKDELLPVPSEILTPLLRDAKFTFDVIYGRQTPFVKMASELEIPIKDGVDMLLFQAVLALNLFYDGKLDEKKIEFAMRKAISL